MYVNITFNERKLLFRCFCQVWVGSCKAQLIFANEQHNQANQLNHNHMCGSSAISNVRISALRKSGPGRCSFCNSSAKKPPWLITAMTRSLRRTISSSARVIRRDSSSPVSPQSSGSPTNDVIRSVNGSVWKCALAKQVRIQNMLSAKP